MRIRCRENGPLVIQMPVEVVDHLGNPFPIPAGKEMVGLCRCGASKRKPFCDGGHNAMGFVGNDLAPVEPPVPPVS